MAVCDWENAPAPKPCLQGIGSWHTEVVPVKGGAVQVLHADGNWYCGRLVQYDEAKTAGISISMTVIMIGMHFPTERFASFESEQGDLGQRAYKLTRSGNGIVLTIVTLYFRAI